MDRTKGRLVGVWVLAFVAIIGFDLFLHAGVLAPLYSETTPFLLSTEEAFRRIPWGYLSFAVALAFLLWLMVRLEMQGWRRGFVFGLVFGAVIWGALTLGLYSISTARPVLLAGWFFGQSVESGIGGLVLGSGLANGRLRPLVVKVIMFFVVTAALGIVIQNLWD